MLTTGDRRRSALLVIDMQPAVVEGCADLPAVVERVNLLIRHARDADAPVVFVQHCDGEDPDAPGLRLLESLDRRSSDRLIQKAYRDAFADTDLEATLARLEVQRLVISGAQSNFCVLNTALSAIVHGYDVAVVSDAHTTRSDGDIDAPTIIAVVNRVFRSLTDPWAQVELLQARDTRL